MDVTFCFRNSLSSTNLWEWTCLTISRCEIYWESACQM